MPDGRLTTVENLVLAAPEHQLAHIFGEGAWRAYDEVQRGRNRCVQVGIAYQLPADLVDERQANVEDHEVDIREVGGGSIHIPGLGVLDRLWAEWHALMHADGGYAQLECLLKYRESYARVIHAPGEWLAVVVAHVIEFEGLCTILFDLAFHQIKRLPALQRIDAPPEYRPVRIFLRHRGTLLPLR